MSHLPETLGLIALDRDGVINEERDDFIKSPEEWVALPGAIEALVELQRFCEVVIATNQSGIARGLLDLDALDAIHDKLSNAVLRAGGRAPRIYFCPHAPDAGCPCRKPAPGLLQTAMGAVDAKPADTVFVGDSARDLAAARACGVVPVLVRTGNGRRTERGETCEHVYDDLAAFAAFTKAQRSSA